MIEKPKLLSKKDRLYQIDLFRFIAAISVLLHHYLFRGYAEGNMSTINFEEVSQFFKYGYLGVDFFFIISGFVISLSIKSNSLRGFAVSRITRLYPIYWLSVIITFGVIFFFGAPRYDVSVKQLVFNLTMFQDYFGVDSIDGVYWSLVIEMRFYIMIALLLIANKFKKVTMNTFVNIWLFISVLIILFDQEIFLVRIVRYVFILEWSSYFIAGIVFSQIYKDGLKLRSALILMVCLLLTYYNLALRIEEFETFYKVYHSIPIIFTTVTIFFIIMLLVSLRKLRYLNSSKFLKIGLLTYPLYLLHQINGFVIFNALNGIVNKYVLLTSVTILMLFISYFIVDKIEPLLSTFLRKKLMTFFDILKK